MGEGPPSSSERTPLHRRRRLSECLRKYTDDKDGSNFSVEIGSWKSVRQSLQNISSGREVQGAYQAELAGHRPARAWPGEDKVALKLQHFVKNPEWDVRRAQGLGPEC